MENIIGIGDELIVTGQARVMQEARIAKGLRPLLIHVRDRDNGTRKHPAWLYNPRIATRSDRLAQFEELENRPGIRPYIAHKSETRWTWKDFECPVGELYFSEAETAYAAQFSPDVVIEPHNKEGASPNKQWGWIRWNKLAYLLGKHGVRVTQMGPEGTALLDRAEFIETPNFRMAAAVLARARAAALPEGGLMHAAAAVGVRAAVIFGGFISPRQTGYAMHSNLFTGGEPCGWRVSCKHCAKAMDAITPEQVCAETMRILRERSDD